MLGKLPAIALGIVFCQPAVILAIHIVRTSDVLLDGCRKPDERLWEHKVFRVKLIVLVERLVSFRHRNECFCVGAIVGGKSQLQVLLLIRVAQEKRGGRNERSRSDLASQHDQNQAKNSRITPDESSRSREAARSVSGPDQPRFARRVPDAQIGGAPISGSRRSLRIPDATQCILAPPRCIIQ